MENVINTFKEKILDKSFSCVAAKDALNKGNIEIFTADHLACPHDDEKILDFIHNFTKKQASRNSQSDSETCSISALIFVL